MREPLIPLRPCATIALLGHAVHASDVHGEAQRTATLPQRRHGLRRSLSLPPHHRARPEDQTARQCVPRRGQAQDVAAAITFLTSPAASFISAQSLHIDGGWMPH